VQEVDPPVVACLTDKAQCEWHLGMTASCQATTVEAIALAKRLNEMHGIAEALYSILQRASAIMPAILLKWNAWHRM
jgi:hypothetical protein